MLIICYLPLLSMGTIVLPSDDAVCVNAAVEIKVLDYNVAIRCLTSTYGKFVT